MSSARPPRDPWTPTQFEAWLAGKKRAIQAADAAAAASRKKLDRNPQANP